MSRDHQPSERELFYSTVDGLIVADRELDAAADNMGGLADPKFMRAIADAKDAINRAKDAIGA